MEKRPNAFFSLFIFSFLAVWFLLAAPDPCFAGDVIQIWDDNQELTQPANSAYAPIIIRDSIPQHNAGIDNHARVSRTTSIAMLIESSYGIDITDPGSFTFTINDDFHQDYERSLDDDTFRVVKISDDADERATMVWVIYDRSLETYMPMEYDFESHVLIGIDVMDIAGNEYATDIEFRIESEAVFVDSQFNLPKTTEIDPYDPILEGAYDSGLEVIDGPLAGATIIFNSYEPLTPAFGSMDELGNALVAGTEAVGPALNLIPHTVFSTPVKVFIPFPGHTNVSGFGLYYHDGVKWRTACDAEGNVLPGGRGWMVPGSRINHNGQETSFIEIEVYHFSSTRGFVYVSTGNSSRYETEQRNGSYAYISCFVDTASRDGAMPFWIFCLIVLAVGLSVISARSRS